MATATMVQTNHDVERAVVPSDFAQRPRVSMSLLLRSVRMIQACRRLNHSRILLQVIKFAAGALVGVLSLMSAWWALDLAMWTSVKDFREDCREQLQNFNVTSTACHEALNRPLNAPPTWRGYLGKATAAIPGQRRWYKLEDRSLDEDELCPPESRELLEIIVEKFPEDWDPRYTKAEHQSREDTRSLPPRRHLASKSARPLISILYDELDTMLDHQHTGIRKQGDAAIMYGAMGGQRHESRHRELFFPLDAATQDLYEGVWEFFAFNQVCCLWLNTTSTGAVQVIQAYPVPDQRDQPDAFEDSVRLMPLEMQARWQQDCVYNDIGYNPPLRRVRTRDPFGELAEHCDIWFVLGLTFILVALGHEIIYGGFARKTRWKWQ